jgi:hypothetical protein
MSDFRRLRHVKDEMMDNAIELLRAWAEDDSEEAFAKLVARHIDFVYSVALRKLAGAGTGTCAVKSDSRQNERREARPRLAGLHRPGLERALYLPLSEGR